MAQMMLSDNKDLCEGYQRVISEAIPWMLAKDFKLNLDKIKAFFQDLNNSDAKLSSRDHGFAKMFTKLK